MRKKEEYPDRKELGVIQKLFAIGLVLGLASCVFEVYGHAFKQLGLVFALLTFATLLAHQGFMVWGFWRLSRRYASKFLYCLPSFVRRQ